MVYITPIVEAVIDRPQSAACKTSSVILCGYYFLCHPQQAKRTEGSALPRWLIASCPPARRYVSHAYMMPRLNGYTLAAPHQPIINIM